MPINYSSIQLRFQFVKCKDKEDGSFMYKEVSYIKNHSQKLAGIDLKWHRNVNRAKPKEQSKASIK